MPSYITKCEIIFIKKNNYKSQNPYPTYFKEGFYVIKLYTSDGLDGLGEPSPYAGNFKKIIKNFKLIFSYIKNKNIFDISVTKLQKKLETKNIFTSSCFAGFSQCIYDIKGKIKKKSISKLINNNDVKNKIKIYASGGMIYDYQSDELLIKEALFFKKKNFFGWKFRPPFPRNFGNHNKRMLQPPEINTKKLINISQKLRKILGTKFNLMLDLGCRCKSLKEFEYLSDGLSELNFFFIEEPFQRKLKLYKKIKLKNINISAGEHLFKNEDILNWINIKKLDYIQLDLNLNNIENISKIFVNYKKKNQVLLPHNWNNMVNEAITYNFMNSFKSDKDLIVEKNILNNPYVKIFENKCFKIINGVVKFKKYFGHGVNIKKNELLKFNFKSIII